MHRLIAHRHSCLAIMLGLLIVISSGCRKPEVELARVRGTVMMDGKPLPNATVRFIPQEKGRTALGRTDENGQYEMLYSASADGAVVGKVRVEITTAEEFETKRGTTAMGKEIVPSRYNSDSELMVVVEPSANTLDFTLDSK